MPHHPTRRSDFAVDGTRCAAWLTRPAGRGPHPVVVLVHGLGANHTMKLEQYEQGFAQAGIAVLAFDFRHLGESEGDPRQRVSMRRHRRDVHGALDHVRALPDLDAARVALWGTSLGAMHVVRVASERQDLAAAVVQCPIVFGPGAAATSGLAPILRLTPAILDDALRGILGLSRRYVKIVGERGERAIVGAPGAQEGWNSTVSRGGTFVNEVTAASALGLVSTTATRHARRVTAPLLVCVSDNEGLMSPKHAVTVAERAPRGERRHYAADHFEVYHPPILESVLADQTAFLRRHLHVEP
ncbi:alpha/beta fold hydrolase [Kribbella sp. NPDC023855]|uniref:alpha/beta hydrolase n=1 Tax=Kribbella sp. NPDC023855 TaxID=3154698 RepID=UPI00340E0E3F